MNQKTLVLNLDLTPLTLCTVNKAFLLVYLQKAELVKEKKGAIMRSISQSFPMPSVIKLKKYVNMPYKGVILTRENIFKRDGHQCQYCGTNKNLTVDHVVPKSKGGKTVWGNLVTACKSCNAKKGDEELGESGMKLNSYPYKPSYILFIREFSGHKHEEWKPYLNNGDEFFGAAS